MSRDMPAAIETYFEGANAFDAEVAASGFADEAVVRDEGRDHIGRAAIRAWVQDTIARYATQFDVQQVTAQGDDVIARVTISGRFPGSPVSLAFSFRLTGGRIVELAIR